MKIAHRFSISTAALLLGLGTLPAAAQEASNIVVTNPSDAPTTTAPATNAPNTTVDSGTSVVTEGNLNAENNIEQGLKSGQLTPDEAARLQAHQARIDRIESHDLRDGTLTTDEQNRIDNAENREENHITAMDSNNVTADPTSQTSTRMERDVQRNVNQQNHIVQGVTNGQLTNTEVSGLENGQARINGMEAKAGRNGTVSNGEQHRIRMVENFSRDDIRHDRHNGDTANGANTSANVTTQGTVNGAPTASTATPVSSTTNVNATTPTTNAAVNNNNTAAVRAAPSTVMNGSATGGAPAAAIAHGHR